MTTHDELRKRISHLTTADLDRARQLWADIGRETDGIKLLAALLDELEQYKAQRDGLLVAAKKADRMYGSLWDSSEGGGFIFPERVKDYDEAFDALNKAIATAEDKA